MGVMTTMGYEGDVKKCWDRTNRDETEDARRSFNNLKAKGYLAFRTDKEGNKAELMREFDPEAESIIMSPAVVGG